MSPKKNRFRQILKWILGGLPLGAAVVSSFFPLQAWMQQSLILVVLIWLQAFLLLNVFYLGT